MTIALGPSNRILRSQRYKWWVYAAIAIGLFVTAMDHSGVNIALPSIADHFSADIPTVQWITLGYVLSTSVMLMPMGRLSDMVGRKRVYVVGFVIFVGAAALGGSAQTFYLLVGAKVIQGIGAAAIQANGMAIIAEVFPERDRGKALGLYMTVIGAGAISGPIIGGLLVSGLGWRSVFYASIPVGFVALAAALAVLRGGAPAQAGASRKLRFDWPGASLSSAALVMFLLGMTNGHRLGWESPAIVAGLVLASLLLLAFLWWERRATDPMLDLNFFRRRVFSMGVSARFFSFLGGSAVFFLMPFYLMQALGYPASKAGLMLVPGSICMAIMAPNSGRLSDRMGTRWPAVLGMALSAAAMFIFTRLTVDSSPVHVIIGMMLFGSGMGTFSSPNSSAILGSLDRRKYGIASAFLNLARTSANVTGIVVATIVVATTMGSLGYEPSLAAVDSAGGEGARSAFVTGLNKTFLVSGSLMLLAMALSMLRGEARPTQHAATEPAPASPSSPSNRQRRLDRSQTLAAKDLGMSNTRAPRADGLQPTLGTNELAGQLLGLGVVPSREGDRYVLEVSGLEQDRGMRFHAENG